MCTWEEGSKSGKIISQFYVKDKLGTFKTKRKRKSLYGKEMQQSRHMAQLNWGGTVTIQFWKNIK
jgi:hypothetical protein